MSGRFELACLKVDQIAKRNGNVVLPFEKWLTDFKGYVPNSSSFFPASVSARPPRPLVINCIALSRSLIGFGIRRPETPFAILRRATHSSLVRVSIIGLLQRSTAPIFPKPWKLKQLRLF